MELFQQSDQRAYQKLNKDIISIFAKMVIRNIFSPSFLLFFGRAFRHQYRALRRRLEWERQGLHVPAFMIVSVTSACNLRCKGCYSSSLREGSESAMSVETLRKLLTEARSLGVGIVLISGGEPLSYPGILELLSDFPEIVFALFTNGLHIDGKAIETFKRCRHVIPVISLEGDEQRTDERRGSGVFRRVVAVCRELKENRLLHGTSLTVTRDNYSNIFDENFVREIVARGSSLVFFVEYIPADENTQGLVPDDAQRVRVPEIVREFRSAFPALFFAFPFDEEAYGGCLASGRGFLHISATGDVEPCPFAPYSDTNIEKVSLKDALHSPLLENIRRNHDKLSETKGGCALWKNREWLRTL